MSLMVRARLQSHNFTHPVTLLKYAGAGHGAFGPPIGHDTPAYALLDSLGGTADGNAAARADSWPKALAFLDVALKTGK
jgi:dienelactone hydrolase